MQIDPLAAAPQYLQDIVKEFSEYLEQQPKSESKPGASVSSTHNAANSAASCAPCGTHPREVELAELEKTFHAFMNASLNAPPNTGQTAQDQAAKKAALMQVDKLLHLALSALHCSHTVKPSAEDQQLLQTFLEANGAAVASSATSTQGTSAIACEPSSLTLAPVQGPRKFSDLRAELLLGSNTGFVSASTAYSDEQIKSLWADPNKTQGEKFSWALTHGVNVERIFYAAGPFDSAKTLGAFRDEATKYLASQNISVQAWQGLPPAKDYVGLKVYGDHRAGILFGLNNGLNTESSLTDAKIVELWTDRNKSQDEKFEAFILNNVSVHRLTAALQADPRSASERDLDKTLRDAAQNYARKQGIYTQPITQALSYLTAPKEAAVYTKTYVDPRAEILLGTGVQSPTRNTITDQEIRDYWFSHTQKESFEAAILYNVSVERIHTAISGGSDGKPVTSNAPTLEALRKDATTFLESKGVVMTRTADNISGPAVENGLKDARAQILFEGSALGTDLSPDQLRTLWNDPNTSVHDKFARLLDSGTSIKELALALRDYSKPRSDFDALLAKLTQQATSWALGRGFDTQSRVADLPPNIAVDSAPSGSPGKGPADATNPPPSTVQVGDDLKNAQPMPLPTVDTGGGLVLAPVGGNATEGTPGAPPSVNTEPSDEVADVPKDAIPL